MNRSTPGLPVHHQLPKFTQTHVIGSVMPSSHLILCCPLLLLPPTPPSIRVFSNESTLLMRWPKYWSFSFSIIPSKEIPGLIFRIEALESRIPRKGEPGQCRISEAKVFHPNQVNYTRPFLLLHDPSWTL